MKKSVIYLFLSLIVIIILVIVIGDFRSTRPDRMSGNPYKLNLDKIKSVDPDLVTYHETKNYRINARQAGGIAVAGEKICQMPGSKQAGRHHCRLQERSCLVFGSRGNEMAE
jgi:hypothetical protein